MRLFTAIIFNEEIKNSLYDTIEKLQASTQKGSFTTKENLHLTLNFIGETERVEEVKQAMNHAVMKANTHSFPITIRGFGRFKRREGDIYWAGIQEERTLWRLQKEMQKELIKEGFVIDDRDYKPHLTLGRRVLVREKFNLEQKEEEMPQMSMEVIKISLMKSERIQGKLTYTEIYHVRLEKDTDK
jgi:2'-5' RNA ligase